MRSAWANASHASFTSGIIVTFSPSKVGSLASLVLLCVAKYRVGELLAQVEYRFERLARVLGEALPLGQLVNA